MILYFKQYFNEGLSPKQNKRVFQTWEKNVQRDDTVFNSGKIIEFVGLMSSESNKYFAQGMSDHRAPVKKDKVVSFLNIEDKEEKLKNFVARFDDYKIEFDAGNIFIIHPVMVYSKADGLLLDSIVKHELGHAVDYLKGIEVEPSSGLYKFNAYKYATNLGEARRLTQQLNILLSSLDFFYHSPDALIDAVVNTIKGNRPDIAGDEEKINTANYLAWGKTPQELLPVVRFFLRNQLEKIAKNEYITERILNLNKTVSCVNRIFNLMQLRNFIKKA